MANVDITLKAIDQTKPGFDSAIANANAANAALSKLGGTGTTVGQAFAKTDPYRNAANEMNKLNQAASNTSGGIASLASGWKFLTGTILAAGTVRVAKETYQLARLGAEASFTSQKFDNLSRTIGTTGDALLNDLRIATKGTLSDFSLMQQGTNLLNLDLASTRAEAIRLSRVMAGLGMDTGELTLALANQSVKRLDQLNVSYDRFKKIREDISQSTGLTGQALFKEAFLQSAEFGLERMGNQADSQLGDYMRFEAGIQNAKVAMGSLLVRAITKADENYKANPWLTSMLMPNISAMKGTVDYNKLNRNYVTGAATPYVGNNLAQQSSYEAMARYWMAPERTAGGGGGEGAELDYAAILEGALKITTQTEKYRDVTSELNSQLMDQTVLLQKTAEKYGLNSDKAKDAYTALKQTQEQIKAARAAQAQTGAGYVMGNLAGMEADPQVMLDFAMAAGLVTQEAYKSQSAYLAVADAINTGAQSAAMGAQLAGNIAGALTKLDGERFTTYVDVIVNWIGNANIFGGKNGLNRQNNAAVQLCFAAGTMIAMANGGQKKIQDIQPGDMVLSWDFKTDALIPAVVAHTYHHTAEEMGEYFLIINQTIRVTPNHPLYINGEWQNAELVKYADELKTRDGSITVNSVVRVYRKIETYNLHIDDENHNYFADGILAHNKAEGGLIRAPGDGSKDTVMVPLANGEYVIRASETKKYMPLLEAINDGRFLMGMAGGGTVGGRTVTRGGSLGGRTVNRASSSSSRGNRAGFFSTGVSGFSGGSAASIGNADVGVIVSEAAADLAPSVSAAVADVVAQTVTNSPQIAALTQSVAIFEEMNETLNMLLAKTPSGGDIGRAVNGDLARVA